MVEQVPRGMSLQIYAQRLQQLTSTVGCTGRSLQFTVNNNLCYDNQDSYLKWEIVADRELQLLSTVISYLALEFADSILHNKK